MAPRRRLAALAALVFALASGCDDEGASPGQQAATAGQTTMQFNVDPALIGPMQRFEAFNVQIAPPAGWEPLPDEQVAAVAAAAGMNPGKPSIAGGETPDPFAVEPLAVFAKPDQGMWLIVSAVSVPETAAFESTLRTSQNVMAADQFTVEGIDVHQYLLRPPKLVTLKLLVSSPQRTDPRRLQLDYVLPEAQYNTSGRSLESSLGSIRPIGQSGA